MPRFENSAFCRHCYSNQHHQPVARRSKQRYAVADTLTKQTPRDDNAPVGLWLSISRERNTGGRQPPPGKGKLIIENRKCRVLKTARSAVIAIQISTINQ
jgi:hypothetical protein